MHTLHEMTEETYQRCIENGADLSLDGYILRLKVSRDAIRFRHKQTKLRHFCHNDCFKASFLQSTLKIRRVIRNLKHFESYKNGIQFYENV